MNQDLRKKVYERFLHDLNLLKNGVTIVQVMVLLVLIFQGILTLILLKRLS